MTISYNNKSDYNTKNYLTFTEIPNIVKVSEDIQGSRSTVEIDLEGNMQEVITADGQFHITILGETVTSVMNPKNARNKRFYVSSDEDSTAFSITQALRNCASLSAQFKILHSGPSIHIVSKELGSTFTSYNDISTNIDPQFITVSYSNGSVNSDFFNGKVVLDVYDGETDDDLNYVTTLEKNFYGNEVGFDVSPVLSTFSEYGKTHKYTFYLNLVKGVGRNQGDWQHLTTISGYTAIGYHANQSEKMLDMTNNVRFLANTKRGVNNITRYVYAPSGTIPYSVLVGENIGGWSYSVSYKDSAFNEIGRSENITDRKQDSSNIQDRFITIAGSLRNTAYYIDLTIGNETIRFKTIKPTKATEYYQRVEWRNEYGGISFFDFTSTRSESDKISVETYEKNIYDYHEKDNFEKEIIYKNNYEKEVKLSSHLLEEGGKWVFNSLMLSKKVWTYVEGVKYYIIPTNIEVVEDSTYNNIYKATLTYRYSDI